MDIADKGQNKEYIFEKTQESSNNMILVAEKALDDNPTLEEVVLIERPPRNNSMTHVSEFSNFTLRGLHSHLIQLSTMTGHQGRGHFTERLVNIVKKTVVSPESWHSHKRKEIAMMTPMQSNIDALVTSNYYDVLNC